MERVTEATCCVLGCSSSPLTGQTFHFFPRDQEKNCIPFKDESGDITLISRRDAWRMLLRLNTINQRTRVCSKHFQDSEFQKTRRPSSTHTDINKNMLRTSSLPTLSLPKPLNSGEQHYVIKDLERNKFSASTKIKKIVMGVTAYVCCVPDCLHSNILNDCKLFVIPNNPVTAKAAWSEFTSKFKENIYDESRVCSCHFLDDKLEGGPVFFPSDFEDALGITHEKKSHYIFKLIPSSFETWDLVSESCPVKCQMIVDKEQASSRSINASIDYSTESDVPSRVDLLKDDPDLFFNLSGFKSIKLFETFLSVFDQDYIDVLTERKGSLPFCDQILSCLVKLRHNYSFSFIGREFLLLSGDAKGVFERCSAVMESVFCDGVLDVGKLELNNVLWQQFPECKLVFFSVEVLFEKDEPANSSVENNKIIKYKSLISVTPTGIITYVGPFFLDTVHNEEIINKSQIASVAQPGDVIFLDDTTAIQVKEIKDSRLILTGPSFSFSSKIYTHLMHHVNKITKDLLNNTILKFVPAELNHLSLRIWRIVCAINNFKYADPEVLKEFYVGVQGMGDRKGTREKDGCEFIPLYDES